jgi:hypothetical protein
MTTKGASTSDLEINSMRWYAPIIKSAQSWDPTPNETIPPQDVPPANLSLSMPAEPVVTKKKGKMRPGGKKRKIRFPAPMPEPGRALGPAFPQDAARPNAASSDPHDLHGM